MRTEFTMNVGNNEYEIIHNSKNSSTFPYQMFYLQVS